MLNAKTFGTTLVALLAVACSGHGREEARLKLATLNLPFTSEGFVQSAQRGDVVAVELYLASGLSPSVIDASTALLNVAVAGRADIAKLLLKSGANATARTSEGVSAVLLASQSRSAEMVELLLNAGADASTATPQGVTPLHAAVAGDDTETVKLLLKRGAKTDAKTADELLPVHLAARSGSPEMLGLLVKNGADANAPTPSGATALHLAAARGSAPLIKQLLELGAKADAEDVRGFTPLIAAASSGDRAAVEMLLAKGVDLQHKSKTDDLSAIDYARKFRRPEIVKLLADKGARPLLDDSLATADELTGTLAAMINVLNKEVPLKGQVKAVKPVTDFPQIVALLQKNQIDGRELATLDLGKDAGNALVVPTKRSLTAGSEAQVYAVKLTDVTIDGAVVPLYAEIVQVSEVIAERDKINDALYQQYFRLTGTGVRAVSEQAKTMQTSGAPLSEADVALQLFTWRLAHTRGVEFGARELFLLAQNEALCRVKDNYKLNAGQWRDIFSNLFRPGETASEEEKKLFGEARASYCATGGPFKRGEQEVSLGDCLCDTSRLTAKAPSGEQRRRVGEILAEVFPGGTPAAPPPVNAPTVVAPDGKAPPLAH